jgi:hypothetical protein
MRGGEREESESEVCPDVKSFGLSTIITRCAISYLNTCNS